MYLLQRNGKFLSERYQWQLMPHAFPEWQFGQVLEMAMNFKDAPQQIGEVMPDGQIRFTDVRDLGA